MSVVSGTPDLDHGYLHPVSQIEKGSLVRVWWPYEELVAPADLIDLVYGPASRPLTDRPRPPGHQLLDRRSVSTRTSARPRTNVPWPVRVSTNPWATRSLIASRTVVLEIRASAWPYCSLSSTSVLSRVPPGSLPDSICCRRSSAMTRYTGSATVPPPSSSSFRWSVMIGQINAGKTYQ
jgi:hypothetical protein